MHAVYLACVAIFLCAIAGHIVKRPRQGVLSLLSIVFICNGALPWDLIPVPKVASVAEGGLALLCIGWFVFFRRDRSEGDAGLFNLYNLLAFLFLVLMVINFVQSNSLHYAVFKTEVLAIEGILPIFGLAALSPFSKTDMQTMILSVAAGAGMVVCRVFLVGGIETNTYISTILNSNVISMGRYIGLGAVVLLSLFLFRRNSVLNSIVIFVCVSLMVMAMLVIGERGPVLGLPVAMALVAVFVPRHGGEWLRFLGRVLVVAGIGGVSFLLLNLFGLQSSRALRVVGFLNGQSQQRSGRLIRFQSAWEAFIHSHGLGIGTGGFTLYFGSPYYDYPHNIVFEIIAEEGLIGLALFVATLIVVGIELVRRSRAKAWDTWSIAILSMWLFMLFNAQVSGDIGANATVWTIASLLFMYRGYRNEVRL